ncbi:MAG: hypothetical protein J7L34_09255 [Thermotogaceae bacterium]|nr:hypothetical protein [Thermotogaceae bacterium]
MEEKKKNETNDKETDKNVLKMTEKVENKTEKKYSKIRLIAAGVVVLVAILLILVRVMNFNRPPLTPSVISPQDGSEISSNEVLLKWQSSDPDGDKVYYDLYLSINGDEFKKVLEDSTKTSYIVRLSPGMKYKWKVVSKDEKGGVTQGPIWVFFTKENNPPAVPIALNPHVGETISSTEVVLSWDCHDIDGDSLRYRVFVDGNLIAITEKTSYKISVNYGNHVWKLEAEDSRGAKSEGGPWSFSVVKVNHSPVVTIIYPKGEIEEGTITLKWEGKDEDGDKLTYKIYLNEKLLEETSGESTTLELKPGEYKLRVVASDGKLVSQDESSFMVKVIERKFDTIKTNMPPLMPFGPKPYNGAVVQAGKIVLSWASEDLDSTKLTYDLYINGDLVASDLTAPRFSYTFPAGEHRWQIIVKDDSGNVVKGPEWDFKVIEGEAVKTQEVMKMFVASGVEGVYIVEIPTLRVLYNFSLYPAYSISSHGNDVLVGNGKTLILMKVVGDYLEVQKTWEMPSEIKEVFIYDGMEYAVGEDFIYINGKTYKIRNNGSFAISDDEIYLAVGKTVKVYNKSMEFLKVIDIGDYVKRVKVYQDKLFIFTEGSFIVVENGEVKKISLPSPKDALYLNGIYYIADGNLGIVKLDDNLTPIDVINVEGAGRIWIYDNYIVVSGKGIYLLKDDMIIKKIGIGENVEKIYGKYYATKDKVYDAEDNKIVYRGNDIRSIGCGKKGFAAIDAGFLIVNGRKLNYKGYNIGFYEGSYYTAGGDVTYIFDENGKLLSKYGKPSVFISRNGYVASYTVVWRLIDGKEQTLSSKAVDIDADIIVAVLEQDGLEIFSWNLNLINKMDTEGCCVATKGNYIFVGTKGGINIYRFKKSDRVGFIPLPDHPKDLYVDGNKLLIADGENGVVVYDITDPENPILEDDQYNMKVYDVSWR